MAKSTIQQEEPASGVLLGAIDIGSNSIRMVIGQMDADGRIELLEKAQRGVRLGQDSFLRTQLGRATMQAAVAILREFRRKLDSYGVEHIWTVATSAVREAQNADVFMDRVLMATGLEVDIIDAPLEGRLTVSAVRSVMDSGKPSLGTHTLITEVGGGNTMLTILEHGEIEAAQSLPLGSIRLQEVLGTSGQPAGQVAALIQNEVVSVLSTVESVMSLKDIKTVFAVGADARFAASLIGKPLENPHFHSIRRKAFDKLVEKFKSLSIADIVSKYDIPYEDAETLLPALMIYQELFSATKAKELVVSSVSMRDGLQQELARGSRGQEDKSFAKEVIQSSLSIAEKFKVNLHHARRVAGCATRLYDELIAEHGLSYRHRVLLESAALLHEIGTFVSTRAYHKHTSYLISNAEIYGLTRSEVAIVANVARYHRRSSPKPTHPEYMSLSQENRIVVNKLAAILRLAKALDVSDAGSIDQLKCRIEQDQLTVLVPGMSDLSVRKRSLDIRTDLFVDVYGVKVEFDTI
ncbi:MAG: Ppx/GppA phosphatase family protein [Planctomycetota bacterium]|jgi:exopolyphosphatase/guanosine-5'-triphosphate,3'-diphosphate pyrophosphatase